MNYKHDVIHGHIAAQVLEDDGLFPNNPSLPVLVYKGGLFLHPEDEPEKILEIFAKHQWSNGWKDGIHPFHHYHSNTHEVLGIFCGTIDLQLGGPEGICVELNRGDVVLIPAGVAHKNLRSSEDFLCVGAYPGGLDYDMNYGKDEERKAAIANIADVAVPVEDPLFGKEGPLFEYWK